MKILQVIHEFPIPPVGGAIIYTYILAKELSKRHDVCVFFRNTQNSDEKYIKKENYENIRLVSANGKTENSFVEILDEFQPDIVHFQHLINLPAKLVDIVYQRRIPIVFTVHDYWLLCPQVHLVDYAQNICNILDNKSKCVKCYMLSRLFKLDKFNIFKIILSLLKIIHTFPYILYIRPKIIKNIIRKVGMFIVPSRLLYDRLVKYRIAGKKLVYNDLGVSNIGSVNIQKTYSKQVRFGFVGSESYKKGFYFLIQTFERIENAMLNISGLIKEETLEKYKSNKNIVFKGQFEHKDLLHIFSEIDILIVPSLCVENSPLVIREAFAAKTPVIASNIGGMQEMVQHGKTGLLFQVGDANDLTDKIRYFINSPDEISRMSNEIKPVKSIKDDALAIENIYRSLIVKKS